MSTPEHDQEWETLVEDWQGGHADIPTVSVEDMKQRVQRQQMRLIATTMVEVAVSAGMIGWTVMLLREGLKFIPFFISMVVWAFLVAAWSFTLWNRRGFWRPQTDTLKQMVEFLFERCQRRLEMVTFSLMLTGVLVPFLVVCSFLVYYTDSLAAEKSSRYLLSWGVGVLYLLGCVIWLIRYRRRVQREMEALEPMRCIESQDE